ncbi:MAG: hypothetical protein P4L48_23445 [Mycobacterium sp.]|nr:hypothetical protein [Mycobacterium sp.]
MKSAEAAMLDSTGYSADDINKLAGRPDDTTKAAQQYDQAQRAADEATVKSASPDSTEAKAAAARLRDYATATDARASAEAQRLAGERLSDYTMSKQVGPFQKDPITGSDPVSRAKDRLYMQQVAESGGMSPDRATAMMDRAEARARTEYPKDLLKKLEASGMSAEGAEKVVSDLEHGKGVPEELVRLNQGATGAGEGLEARGEAVPTGKHWGDAGYSAKDAEALGKMGKYIGRGASVSEVLFGVYEWQHGEPLDEVAVKTGSSIWGGMAAGGRLGAIGGEFVGPEGALVFGAVGAIGGGIVASDAASSFYKWLKE